MKTKNVTPELNKSLMIRKPKRDLINEILAQQIQDVTRQKKRKSHSLLSEAPTPKKDRLENKKHPSTPSKANITIKQERDSDEVGQREERSTDKNSPRTSANKNKHSKSPKLNNSYSNKLNVKIKAESSSEGKISLPKSKFGVEASSPTKLGVSSSPGNAIHTLNPNHQILDKNKEDHRELTDSTENWSSEEQKPRPLRLEYEDKVYSSREFLSTTTSSSLEDEVEDDSSRLTRMHNVQRHPQQKFRRSILKTAVGKSSSVSEGQADNSSGNEMPSPKQIKTQLKSRNKLVSVPMPMKSEVSDSITSFADETKRKRVSKKHSNGSESESSFEEEKLKPKAIKSVHKSKKGADSVLLPGRSKVSEHNGSSGDEMRSREMLIKQNSNMINYEFEVDSSAEEKVLVRTPERIKSTLKSKKKPVAVPLPIKLAIPNPNSSSEDETRPKQELRKQNSNKRNNGFEPESSSGEEVSVPAPKHIKSDLKSKKIHVPVPSPIKLKVSDPDNSSSDDTTRINRDSPKRNSNMINNEFEQDTSSEEEGPMPKPKQIKSVLKSKKQPVPVPLPIKSKKYDPESSSADETKRTKEVLSKRKSNMIGNEFEPKGSPEEEVPMPKPKQVKNDHKSRKQLVLVPSHIKSKVSDPFNSSVGESRKTKQILHKQNNNIANNEFEPGSSTEEEVSVPRPKQIKSDLKSNKPRVPVPSPIKLKVSDPNDSSADDTTRTNRVSSKQNNEFEQETSSEEVVPMPKPKQIKGVLKSKNQPVLVPLPVKSRLLDSEEEVPMPKPKQIKGILKSKKQPIPVPLPIKSKILDSKDDTVTTKQGLGKRSKIKISNEFPPENRSKKRNSEDFSKASQNIYESINDNAMESQISAASWKENPQDNVTQVLREDLRLESCSDSEIPLPKKIKLDSTEASANELVMESQTSKPLWKEAFYYNAMSWTEKLKHRFPGIEKMNITDQLPKTEAKYSLLLVPKNIDARSLINLKCHFNKITVVNLNNTDYVFEVIQENPDPVLVSMNGPRLVNLQSVISLQRFLPKLSLKEMDIPKRTAVPLPSALKDRHPLFGVTYREKLSLGKKVKKKLQQAIEHKKNVEEKEQRRKKTKRKDDSKGVEESVLNIFNIIDSPNDDLIKFLPVKA